MDAPIHYALLRDGLEWLGERSGLTLAADGSLALTRVPAPPLGSPVDLDGPFAAEPSGIASRRETVFVADTDADRLQIERIDCGDRYATAAGQLSRPAGLWVHGDSLYVCDAGNARVLVFLLPGMELRRMIAVGLSQPTAVAVDAAERVYVLDRGLGRIVRFLRDGSLDAAYAPSVAQPTHLALAGDGAHVYASDAVTESVVVLDDAGNTVGSLARANLQPRAVAHDRGRVFAADVVSGVIDVFDAATAAHLGTIPDFRAPVAGLAFAGNGDLLVKIDGTEAYARCPADGGCIASGTLTVGPLDAGELSDWESAGVATSAPAETALETFTSTADSPTPSATQWIAAPSSTCLLARDPGPAAANAARRFLWLRVTVTSADGRSSPRVTQIEAQTASAGWLEQLPRIYRRDDQRQRFLERWLALLRTEFMARESEIDLAFRRLDPRMAPASALGWLAEALAFESPPQTTPAQLRTLLERLPQLYAERGTVRGIEAMAEIYSGFRPKIIEAYRARRVWTLEESSLLGFDTALAAAAPDGFVVPHAGVTDLSYAGLRGDYYRGTDFDELIRSRTDDAVAFSALDLTNDQGQGVAPFTVRWTGQIKPRYTERYRFELEYAGRARLWIDGLPLVDDWADRPAAHANVHLALDAARWHSIQIELRSLTPQTVAKLRWSSRHQMLETVPRDCLYSLLDEHADLSRQKTTFDVGEAVVGESRPNDVDDFGADLAADYAHLFTVITPAGRCCEPERRAALKGVLDAEKPAHTDYHLCFVEARMRVGFQARLGIDAIVATRPPAGALDGTVLGNTTYLADAASGGGRVAARARLGLDTVTG